MKSSNKEFNKLKNFWYKKLAESGFHDIETPKGGISWKSHSSKFIDDLIDGKSEGLKASIKVDYYRLAGHFLHDYKFESKESYLIWLYHSEGVSCRNISDLLKKDNIYLKKTVINDSIAKHRELMVKLYGVKDE